MAIYHFSAQIIGRSDGRSSVAAAAYRSGDELLDERTGTECRYERRQERIAHTEILAPASAPAWATDRQTLWNRVEAVEKRKDSQLAREFEASLPIELGLDEHVAIVRQFVRDQLQPHGLVADLSFHVDPDRRNPHVHIMVPMRLIAEEGFGAKLRDLNGREQLVTWRSAWAKHVNAALERAGRTERIDHRSLEDQGIDREPTVKEGYAARRREAAGLPSDRCDENRAILARNAAKAGLQQQSQEQSEPQTGQEVPERVLEPLQPQLPQTGSRAPRNASGSVLEPFKKIKQPLWRMVEVFAMPGMAVLDAGAATRRALGDLWSRTRWGKEAEWERRQAAETAAYNLRQQRDSERRHKEHLERMARWEEARERAAAEPSLSTSEWLDRSVDKYRAQVRSAPTPGKTDLER